MDLKEEILGIIGVSMLSLKDKIIENSINAGQKASGNTYNSMRVVKENLSTALLARPYFMGLETGIKPGGGISRDYITDLQKWCENKNVLLGEKNSLRAAWKIAKTKQAKGSLLYRQGGRKDIVTNEVNKFIDELMELMGDSVLELIISKLNLKQ